MSDATASPGMRAAEPARESIAIYVTVETFRRRPFFEDRRLASLVSDTVHRHPSTVVARVRRDRLDWILAGSATGSGTGIGAVERFKAFTAAAAHRLGHRGHLWQPGFWSHPVAASEALARVAGWMLEPTAAAAALTPGRR